MNLFQQMNHTVNTVLAAAEQRGTLATQMAQMSQQQQTAQAQVAREHTFDPEVITAVPQADAPAADNTMLYLAGAAVVAFVFLKKK